MSFRPISSCFSLLLGALFILPTISFADQGDYFPIRTGLTAGPGSHGTEARNEFNLFTNSTPVIADFRLQNVGDQNHQDERDFVTAKLSGAEGGYKHRVDGLNLGDEVLVQVYLHNNAEQTCMNEFQAHDTRVKLNWSNPQDFVASISSPNAIPVTINDIVSFSFNGDYSFERVTSQDVHVVSRINPHSGLCSGTPENFDFTSTMMSSSDTSLTSEVNLGTINGSYAHLKVVFFKLEVVPAQRSLSIEKTSTIVPESTVETESNINYTLTTTNTGNIGLQNVTLTDTLDQNLTYRTGANEVTANNQTLTLSYGDLNADPETLNFTAQVKGTTPNGSRICNSATGSADGADTVSSNEICHDVRNPNDLCGNNTRDLGEQCDDGDKDDGDGCDSTCMWEYIGECGNDELEGPEECEDGNNISGDGCSDICVDEDGIATCGNDIWETSEQCDDGNTTPGDGCSATCEIEDGDGDDDDLCGNQRIDLGEQCDDGGNEDGDGCDSVCMWEYVGVCGNNILEGPEECEDGNNISGDGCSDICVDEDGLVNCGNNIWEMGEQCEDGNTINGDGCSSSCKIEINLCGNNVRNTGEQCDDGGNEDGDGCDSVCMWEYDGVCGNNILEGPEECEDGNNTSGDGCSDICVDEDGSPSCGNSIWEISEQCDDGNTTPGDGCSATCQNEDGDGDDDDLCGNQRIDLGEQCDDGNTTPGDGCSATCQNEGDEGDDISNEGDGGGGGGAPTSPTIGTCTRNESTGALQCTPRYPVEDVDDQDWINYRTCKNNTARTIPDCLKVWAATKGYRTCGDIHPTVGNIIIPYTGSSHADLVMQCDSNDSIVNQGEPCDEVNGAISKKIKHVNDNSWNEEKAFIQKGDLVDYLVEVNFNATPYLSASNVVVTGGSISVYDYTDYLGTSNPPIWERAGIVDTGWEPWIAGGIKHERTLTAEQKSVLNSSGRFTKTLRYRANTNLMSHLDVFDVGNDAFAMLRLRIKTFDPIADTVSVSYQQLAAGGGLCSVGAITTTPGSVSGLDIATGTDGDGATAHIIRPFVEVRGGDAGFRFSDSTTDRQRITGDIGTITGNSGNVISSGNVLVESGAASHLTEFSGDVKSYSNLAGFEEFSGVTETNAFFNNLKQNLSPTPITIPGIDTPFSTTLGDTGVYFINGSSDAIISDNLDMIQSSKTFIIDNGKDLIINNDFEIQNGYAAFIVRNGGDIIIDKNVTSIDGIFIVEEGEIQTSIDPTSFEFEQSYNKLTVSGMLVGDMENLFSYRKFIGESLSSLDDLQPNVLLLFDLRILLATPPALERVLGEGWRQDIEVE